MGEISQAGPAPMEQMRGPLIPQTNSNPRLSSSKPLRRKSSFIYRLDSSEELPDSHESILMAEYLSSNSEDSSHKIESYPSIDLNITQGSTMTNDIDVSRLIFPPIGNNVIKYGHGTPLTTIVEQKSLATLRTLDSETAQNSVSELAVSSTTTCLLGHRNSFELPSSLSLRVPRRRKSFSADDIALIKHSYHEACSTIELSTGNFRPAHTIYAEPRVPVIPPLERPPTPPGMPSWTAAQNAPIRSQNQRQTQILQGKQSKIRRLLGLQQSSTNMSSRGSASLTPRDQVLPTETYNGRAPTGSRPLSIVAPRFRPPRSSHGNGPLEIYPFLTCGSPNIKGGELQVQPRLSQPMRSDPRIHSSISSGLREGFLDRNAKSKTRKCQQAGISRPMRNTTLKCRSIVGPNTNDGDSTRQINEESAGVSINESKQCSRCRKRVECFWGDSNNTHRISSPYVSSVSADFNAVPSRYTNYGTSRQLVGVAPIPETRFQRRAVTPAPAQGTESFLNSSNGAYYPTREAIPNERLESQKCWKCRVKVIFQRMDICLEVSTRHWCWVCCGVDMDDSDDDTLPCRSSQEAMMTVARRVALEPTPAIVF